MNEKAKGIAILAILVLIYTDISIDTISDSLFFILIALLLTLECKCEFLPLAYFIPTLSESLGIHIFIIVPCTFQKSGGGERI